MCAPPSGERITPSARAQGMPSPITSSLRGTAQRCELFLPPPASGLGLLRGNEWGGQGPPPARRPSGRFLRLLTRPSSAHAPSPPPDSAGRPAPPPTFTTWYRPLSANGNGHRGPAPLRGRRQRRPPALALRLDDLSTKPAREAEYTNEPPRPKLAARVLQP